MAEPDGAVRVVTLLDNEDFNKGIERMEKAMQSLSDTMEELGKTIDKSFKGYVKAMQGAGAATRQVETALDGAADKTERVGAAADKTAESYGKVAQEADKAKAALSGMGDAGNLDALSGMFEDFKRQISELESAYQGMLSSGGETDATQLSDFEARLNSLWDDFEALEDISKGNLLSGSIAPLDQEAFGRLKELSADFRRVSESATEATAPVEQLPEPIEEAEQEAQSLESDFEGVSNQIKSVWAEARTAAQLVSGLQENADGIILEKDFDAASKAVETLRVSASRLPEAVQSVSDADGFQRLSMSAERLNGWIERIASDFEGLSDGVRLISPDFLTDDIRAAETALSDYQDRVSEMDDGGAQYSAWLDIAAEIADAADEAGGLQAALDALSESGDIDETQYDELSARISDLIGDYDELQDAVSQSTQDAMPQYLENWEQMPTLSEMVSDGFDRIRNAALTAVNAVQHPIQAIDRGLALVAQSALKSGAALLQMARSSILSGLRLIGESADEAARSLVKLTASAVSSGIQRLGGWLSNAARSMLLFGRQTKRSNNVLKKSFTTLLKYGLGVRSFYYLFRKVRQAIGEGYQNLARYSDTLNASISGVISSFKRFENQFAASFEPLVNIVAPAVTQLIDGLTEATFRAGELIATLSGQKTVIKAKEVQEYYAESLDKTKKAAKDAQNQLAEFDKLNILKDNKEDETSPEDMFETVPVADEAKQFADDFEEAWINVDLSGIGEIVGGKIKVALDNIPWPDIQQGAEDIGKRLATFLNGIINVPDLGKSLGKAIADAINAAFAFLDGFVWTFDWKGLGNAIMDTIEAACDNLNWQTINSALLGVGRGLASMLNAVFARKDVWEKVGTTLGNALNAVVNAGLAFVTRFKWEESASSLTAGLNKMVQAVEWDKIGALFGELFGGLAVFIYTALSEFNWAQFGESLASGVNSLVDTMTAKISGLEWHTVGTAIAGGVNKAVQEIEWGDVGTLLGTNFEGVVGTFAAFIRGLSYEDIMTAIHDLLQSAIQAVDFNDLITTIAVGALVIAVKKVIASHPLLSLVTGAMIALGADFGDALTKMINDIPWEENGQKLGESFSGALGRLDDAITSINWQENVAAIMAGLDSFISGIEWDTVGKTLSDALLLALDGIGSVIADLDWKSLGVGIGEAINNLDISGIVSALVEILNNSLIAAIDFLIGLVEGLDWLNLGTEIGKSLVNMITDINWLELAVKLGLLLIESFGVSVEALIGAVAGIFSGIGDALEEAGHDVIGGFFKGIGDAISGGGAWIKEHIFDPFIGWIKNLFGIASPSTVMAEMGGYLIEGLFNGISAAWHFITDFFGDALEGLKTTLGGAWETISGAASTAWNGISTTLSSIMGGIVSNIGGAWETIKTGASGKLKEVAKTVSDKWNDMKTTAATAWDGLKKTVGDTISGVKQDAIAKVSEIVNETKAKWDRIRTDAANDWNGVKSAIVPKAQEIRSQVVSAFQGIQGTLSGVWSGIRSAASGALSSVSATVSSMVSSISSKVSSIRSTVSNITSSASSALSKVADKMDDLTRKAANTVTIGGLSSGGVVTNSGHIRSWYDSVRKYASGTLKAAGSLFVAGEAGPELVGHVNGRTEVLNESQISGAIYSAVLSAMSEAVKTLGGFLSQQMASNTNALIAAIGQIQAPSQIAAPQDTAMLERLAALQSVPYQVPAYATGTVMPYEVVAEIRKQTSELKDAIYDNGEIVIQAIVSAISAHGLSLTNAIGNIQTAPQQGYSPERQAEYTVKYINRVKTMMGKSPLTS